MPRRHKRASSGAMARGSVGMTEGMVQKSGIVRLKLCHSRSDIGMETPRDKHVVIVSQKPIMGF